MDTYEMTFYWGGRTVYVKYVQITLHEIYLGNF